MDIDQKSHRKSRWRLVCNQLTRELKALGLEPGSDFRILGEELSHHYCELELQSRNALKTSVLLACNRALEGAGHWGVIVSAPDLVPNQIVPLVEVSGGGFTFVRGGEQVRTVVLEAYKAVGF